MSAMISQSAWHRAVSDYRALWDVNVRMGVVEDVFWDTLRDGDKNKSLAITGPASSLPPARKLSFATINRIVTLGKSVREGISEVLLASVPWWVWFNEENARNYVASGIHLPDAFDEVLKAADPTTYYAVIVKDHKVY